MSDIFTVIKANYTQARLQRSPHVGSLSALIGDIEIIGKNEQRETTDQDCIKVVKKHLNGVEETIMVAAGEKLALLELERDMLEAFLPTQLSYNEIRTLVVQNNLTTIKEAQSFFRHHYPGRYDGNYVTQAVPK